MSDKEYGQDIFAVDSLSSVKRGAKYKSKETFIADLVTNKAFFIDNLTKKSIDNEVLKVAFAELSAVKGVKYVSNKDVSALALRIHSMLVVEEFEDILDKENQVIVKEKYIDYIENTNFVYVLSHVAVTLDQLHILSMQINTVLKHDILSAENLLGILNVLRWITLSIEVYKAKPKSVEIEDKQDVIIVTLAKDMDKFNSTLNTRLEILKEICESINKATINYLEIDMFVIMALVHQLMLLKVTDDELHLLISSNKLDAIKCLKESILKTELQLLSRIGVN